MIWPAQFAANGYILDLSDRFTGGTQEGYLAGPLGSVQYDGGVWGVPWFTDAGMLYYRKDLLEKAASPSPGHLGGDEGDPGQGAAGAGHALRLRLPGHQDEGGIVDALEYVWNAGGDVLDGDTVVVDSPEAVAGLELRRSMITDGVAPKASGDYTTQESPVVFTNGDVVFMRNWPFVYGLLSDPETRR